MCSELELNLAKSRILRDAPSWAIDFADPANVLTVWLEYPERMMFCGKFNSDEEAWEHANNLPRSAQIYVALSSSGQVDILNRP